MYIIALCMRTWCEVRNFASQKFRLTPGPRIFQFWESKSCQTPTIIDAIETGQWFCLKMTCTMTTKILGTSLQISGTTDLVSDQLFLKFVGACWW